MLTLLLTPLSLCPAAHAGSWMFSCTGSGYEKYTEPGYQENNVWVPPNPSAATTYPYQVGGLSCPSTGGGYTSTSGGDVRTGNISIQATVKLTWTHGSGETDANDPAPPSVMLIESSSASWTAQIYDYTKTAYVAGTGTAVDGIQDAEVDHSAYGAVQGGDSTSATNANISVPPVHWTSYPVSGGVLALPTRTLIAKASCTSPAGGASADFACSVGTYSIQIHPQPYNFHITNKPVDNGDGSISFTYDWYSTTGYKSDLTTCYTHERVTYPGSSNPYVAPAPFTQSVNNPTVLPSTDSSSNNMATAVGNDRHYVWASTGPYTTTVTVTAAQRYEFNDSATHQQNVLTPGPDSTASIVRTITNSRPNYPAGNWWYSITKQGLTAWLKLQ